MRWGDVVAASRTQHFFTEQLQSASAVAGRKIQPLLSPHSRSIRVGGIAILDEENSRLNGRFYERANYMIGESCYDVSSFQLGINCAKGHSRHSAINTLIIPEDEDIKKSYPEKNINLQLENTGALDFCELDDEDEDYTSSGLDFGSGADEDTVEIVKQFDL